MKLEHRKILVTGAASGIGLAIARLFAGEGAAVALLDRDLDGLMAARALLHRSEQHVCLCGDVSEASSVADLVSRAADALGGLDGLVNGAGMDHVAPFGETTLERWRAVLDTNLTAAFLVCQAALPAIRAAGGGTIVNIASGAALRPLEGRTAYCASKAGLVMLSKTLALELASEHIRVNALCPGAVDTPMLRETAGGGAGGPVPESVLARFAMGRIAEPDEIARAALFLSCDDSSFVTGIALAADGGRTFH